MPKPMPDLRTLLQIPYVEPDTGFDVSPDGTQVAFSWNRSGQWEIYVMSLASPGAPAPITAGPGAKFNPQWSPGGERLAYVLDLDGSEAYDLWCYDTATGRHTNLTPDTPWAIQPNYHWSPDGEWLAILADRSGRFETYVLSAAGGPPRLVWSTPYPDWDVRWSPSGTHLAVVAEAEGQDHWTYLVPAEGGEARIVGDGDGPLCARDSRWSPSGKHLAFASDARGRFEIGLYALATGGIRWLTEGEGSGYGDKEQPAWSPDGARLAYVRNHGPLNEIAVLDLERGTSSHHRVGPGSHHRPQWTPDGRQLLFLFDSPARPCDLWSLADGRLQQRTHSLPPELGEVAFVLPEQIEYPSLDGTPVPALLFRPQGIEQPPAVVHVHGGPNWLSQITWHPLLQEMVGRGWAVLAPNYRGSTGYGRAWQLASRFDLGGCDTDDVVAGADYLIDQGLADPDRIAVTGRSWGGYLTMTSLTRYPDRWAGGSAVVPFLNWFTAHANSREDLQHWDLENFGHPERDRDRYYARSPFFFLERIAAPVQMISGAHDVRCPASEAIQARDRLLELGKACELWLYPDEGHSFLQIENVVDAQVRQVEFLARVLRE